MNLEKAAREKQHSGVNQYAPRLPAEPQEGKTENVTEVAAQIAKRAGWMESAETPSAHIVPDSMKLVQPTASPILRHPINPDGNLSGCGRPCLENFPDCRNLFLFSFLRSGGSLPGILLPSLGLEAVYVHTNR